MDIVIKHVKVNATKTGEWRNMKPEVAAEKCIGCGTCVKFCPEAAIELAKNVERKTQNIGIDYEFCKGCGVCANVCPAKAILMKKEQN